MKNFRNLSRLCMILVLSLTLLCTPNLVQADVIHVPTVNNMEVEPNDSADHSNLLQLVNGQAIVYGTVTDSSDMDYFEYTPDINTDVDFLFIPNSNGSYFYAIWDMTTGALLASDTTEVYKENSFELNAGHRCLIAVTASNGSNLDYSISFTPNVSTRQVTLEGQYEMEYNNTVATANKLPNTLGLYCASVSDSNDVDYFTFTAAESRGMKFSFYPECNANFFMMLYDKTSQQYIMQGYITIPGQYQEILYTSIEGHEYQLTVAANVAASSNYNFQFWDN